MVSRFALALLPASLSANDLRLMQTEALELLAGA